MRRWPAPPEEVQCVLDGHVQHLVDVLALVADLQGFPVIALALTDVAGHIDIGQEVHLHLGDAVALAGLAAATLDVEAEPAGFVAPRARFLGAGKQLPDRGEDAGVGGRVGARRAADGALVDVDALVDVLEP